LNLIGHSAGGIIVNNVANALRARGIRVDNLIMLGTPLYPDIFNAAMPSDMPITTSTTSTIRCPRAITARTSRTSTVWHRNVNGTFDAITSHTSYITDPVSSTRSRTSSRMICSRRDVPSARRGRTRARSLLVRHRAEPVWIGPHDVDEFAVLGDDVLTVGSHCEHWTPPAAKSADARDYASRWMPRDPRSSRQPAPPSSSAGTSGTRTSTSSPPIRDRFRSGGNAASRSGARTRGWHPLRLSPRATRWRFRSHRAQASENLFRLRAENGETAWSRYVERFAVRQGSGRAR